MASVDFVHLHTHSHYSLLDGAGKIDVLLKRAKELGMSALALTDHGAMYGSLEFYETAKKIGIKPIIGVEAYLAPRSRMDKDSRLDTKPFHQLLLAENYEGYLNLIKLTSEAHLNGFYYKPRIDKELLKEHSAGLIATSGCMTGSIPRALQISLGEGKRVLEEFLAIFGEKYFFLELQHHPSIEEQVVLNQQLKQLAAEYKIGLIATNDIHYVYPDDAEAQDVLVCVGTGKTVNDPNRLNMTGANFSMTAPEEMAEWFADTPEAISNTAVIAERCKVEIPLGQNILPKYPTPDGITDRQYLYQLCEEGVKRRFNFTYTVKADYPEGTLLESPMNDPNVPLKERIKSRLEYELSVIAKTGYDSYFLIVQDFINWAKEHGIAVGPGRGSAAGSLVGYCVGITDVDPLEHNLIFERFLNTERIGMPDIDTDIEDARRDEVIQYVRERYGSDHVAQIITFGTMAARNAVRDVGRALGVSYNECDYIAKLIPSGPGGMTIKEALQNIPELKQLYESNDQITKLLDIAARLEGVARHTSVHAAGVVITKEPLERYLPLQRSTRDDNSVITQYSMNQVEHIGLLKMDFLGLSNLSILQQAVRIIRKTRKTEIDVLKIPLDDKPTYELLSQAETTGVFQLESSGMKRYLKELKPTQFEDIMSMVALYRPGPMDSIPDFIQAKHGRKKITYLHPILQPILENSYGVLVTQDQVLEVARKFAGFSYSEADVLRKAVGKKIKALLDEQRDKFIKGAVRNPEITQDRAEKVWDFVEPFARYGFNRAHAACYALIAYQTAYLKAHYPVEFMASLMTSDINNLDRIGIEIAECKEMGVEVLAPDINESFVEFGVVFYQDQKKRKRDAYIRFGLGAIKNVGLQPAEAIVEERKANGPFKDLADFLTRVSSQLNKKVLENLAMAGALDSLGERQQILENMEPILRFLAFINKEKNSVQTSLFDGLAEQEPMHALRLLPAKPADQKTRLAWERELLGIYLSDHPITSYLPYLPPDRQPIVGLSAIADHVPVLVCGIVMSVRKILTRANTTMAFVGIEDETGLTEVIVFPKVWTEKEKQLVPGTALAIEGKISRKDSRNGEETQEIKVLMESCRVITENRPAKRKKAAQIRLSIPENGNRELLQKIKQCLELSPGAVPVTLLLPTVDGEQELHISHKVAADELLYSRLATMLGPDRVMWE